MDNLTIYTDSEMSINAALDYMTNDWINSDEYCQKTVVSLRNCLKYLLVKFEDVENKNENQARRIIDLNEKLKEISKVIAR